MTTSLTSGKKYGAADPSAHAVLHRDSRQEPLSKGEPITDHKSNFDRISLALVDAGKLFYDRSYARDPAESRLSRLRKSWNPAFTGTIYLSKRADGSYAVIDGWHRITVAREMGMKELPALVYHGLDAHQEAELYHRFGNVFAQSALVRFKARVRANDPSVATIVEVVGKAGLKIDYDLSLAVGGIRAVSALEYINQQWGSTFLFRVLTMLRDAFGKDTTVFRDDQILGMSYFLSRYDKWLDSEGFTHRLDTTRFLKRLKETGLRVVRSDAFAIQAHSKTGFASVFGMALRENYNHYLRADNARLPEWVERIKSSPRIEAARAAAPARTRAVWKALPPEKKEEASRRATEQARETPAEVLRERGLRSWNTRRERALVRAAELGIICTVEGCTNAQWAREMCRTHYERDRYARQQSKAKDAVAAIEEEMTSKVAS